MNVNYHKKRMDQNSGDPREKWDFEEVVNKSNWDYVRSDIEVENGVLHISIDYYEDAKGRKVGYVMKLKKYDGSELSHFFDNRGNWIEPNQLTELKEEIIVPKNSSLFRYLAKLSIGLPLMIIT